MQAKLSATTVRGLSPGTRPYEVVDPDLKGFLLRVQPSGVMTYYFAYRNEAGKRNRYRIGTQKNLSPAQAREEAMLLAGRVIGGEDIQSTKKRQRVEAKRVKYSTLSGFLEHKYGPWVTAERRTGTATIKRIRANFGHLFDRPLGEINTWVIEKWRSEEVKAGKSKSTVNRDVAALKACLSKAIDWELLASHPLARVKPLKIDKRAYVRYLTDAEEEHLRDALTKREETIRRKRVSANRWRSIRNKPVLPDLAEQAYVDYLQPLVLLAINTGLRRGELFQLQWTDIDFAGGRLTVRGGIAKSEQTRHISLNAEAYGTMVRWCKQRSEDSKWVFAGKEGRRLTSVKTSWGNLLREARIQDFRWHDLRHHFASRLVMEGVDLNTVRELLGHATLEMTLRYAHLSPEHTADAVARIVRNTNAEEEAREAPILSQ